MENMKNTKHYLIISIIEIICPGEGIVCKRKKPADRKAARPVFPKSWEIEIRLIQPLS